jgi:hypothetical protein
MMRSLLCRNRERPLSGGRDLVRVVRGSEHRSDQSPLTGYRYDGLFRVERYWPERGRDGFLVCRYA